MARKFLASFSRGDRVRETTILRIYHFLPPIENAALEFKMAKEKKQAHTKG